MKKITLFGLSLAGLALLAFPHSGQAFELKEELVVKCGVQYQDGKIFDSTMVMKWISKSWICQKPRKSSGRLVSMVKIRQSIFQVKKRNIL